MLTMPSTSAPASRKASTTSITLPPVLINSFGLPLVWLLLGGETVYWINVLWMLLGQTVVLYAVGVPVYYLAKRNLSALIQPEKDKKEE